MPEFLEPIWIMVQVFGGLAVIGWLFLKFVKAFGKALESMDHLTTSQPLNPPNPTNPSKPSKNPLDDWIRN